MASHIVDGLPGAGKNVYIGYRIHEAMRKGRNIRANFPITIPEELKIKYKWEGNFELFSNMYDLTKFRNAYVFVDEAQTYFDARNYQEMPREIIETLRYNRKRKLEIYLIVQHYSRIDMNFRLLSYDFVNVQRVIGSLRNAKTGKYGKPWGLSIARTYYLEDLPASPGPIEADSRWTDWVFVRKRYTADLYDTDYEIPFSKPWPWREIDRPACPDCGFKTPVKHV